MGHAGAEEVAASDVTNQEQETRDVIMKPGKRGVYCGPAVLLAVVGMAAAG
jgi:hypothetical protein